MFDPLAAALAVDKAMKEGHEETLEGLGKASEGCPRVVRGLSQGCPKAQKKKKRSAPGFEPRTFGTRSEGLNRSATEARADQGQERGVGGRGVPTPGQKMVDCFRHIGIGVCFFRP